MNHIFIVVLNHSLSTVFLILAVLVVRLAIKKAPKWISCALWGLVALKLILPFDIKSMFSLIPSSEPVPMDIEYTPTPHIESGISVVNQVVNPVMASNFTPEPVTSVNPMQVVISVCAAIWLFGIFCFLAYFIISYWILRKKVAASKKLFDNVFLCDEIADPFILGIIRPSVYLPSGLSDETRDCVLEHEKAHIARLDYLWKPLGYIILAVYWFQPLCWISYILLCKDIELACDERVTRNKDKDWKASYCQALLDCTVQRKIIAACPVAFGEVGIKDRVKSVLHYKKPAIWVILAALVVCIIVAVCFVTNPKHETAADKMTGDKESVKSEAENGESADEIKPTDKISSTDKKEPLKVSLNIEDYFTTNIGDPSNLYHIDENHILWGCGENNRGQLGQGTQDYELHKEPVKIAEDVIHVDFSQRGFMIFLTKEHKLYGVGYAGSGALQQYNSVSRESYINEEQYCITKPVLLMENVAYARCGRDDIVCLTEDGEVWTWGTIYFLSEYGESGGYFIQEPTKFLENAVFITGGWFNHAALLSDGEVWTWGYNTAGNCGVEEPEYIDKPVKAAEDVIMVWTGSLQYNSEYTSLDEFRGMYPTFLNNTVICKADGSYWICGENIGTQKKVVDAAEADYVTVWTHEFCPFPFSENRDVLTAEEEAAKEVITAFTAALLKKDTQTMLQYLDEGSNFYFLDKEMPDPVIMRINGLNSLRDVAYSSGYMGVVVDFKATPEEEGMYSLSIGLSYKNGKWKINGYGISELH